MSERSARVRRTRRVVRESGSQIRQRYEAGESLAELGEAFGISPATAAATVRRQGGEVRRRNSGIRRGKEVVRLRGAEMRERYEAGARLQDIAHDLGISISTVSKTIRAQGGTIRKRGYGSVPPPRGAANHAYRGGVVVSHGYRLVLISPEHPYFEAMARKGYVLEHRLVMAEMIKRPLLATETVHHIDGDKLNNALDNLQLRLGQHGNGTHWRCGDCGSRNVVAQEL